MKKKCRVAALPTSDHKNFALVKRDFDWVVHEKDGSTDVKTWGHEMHHLYIISDDEIEVGDWCVFNEATMKHYKPEWNLQKLLRVENGWLEYEPGYGFMPGQVFKIIASTDTSLNLPAIPEWFIKEYAEKQVSEVLVEEKTTKGTMIDPNEGWKYGFPKLFCGINLSSTEVKDFIKENGYPIDNYINCRMWEVDVKQLKLYPVKKTWTRDEIEFVLSHIYPEYNKTSGYDWVKQVMAKFDTVEQDMKAGAYKRDFEDRNFYEG